MFPETDQKMFKNQKLLIGHLRLTITICYYYICIIVPVMVSVFNFEYAERIWPALVL